MVVAEPFEIDGVQPAEVVRPESPAEVAEVLAQAARQAEAVVPVGGGRALGMGDPPARLDSVLRTERLDRVVEYRPADQAITVEAGCRLEVLAECLRERGQFAALDPYGGPGHTVGGVLSAGWSGPQRLAFGATRDQVLGLTVALPRGGLVREGGRVIKNVSGYDMARLQVGALGALGVIVEATLRVRPLPPAVATLELEIDDLAAAWVAAERALAARPEPLGVLVSAPSGCGFTVLARYGGPAAAVREATDELGWSQTDPGRWEAALRARSDHWARISMPPGSVPGLLAMLGDGWLAEPGSGVVHWLNAADEAAVRRAREAAETAAGSLVLLAAPPSLKRALGVWGSPPGAVEIMRRLRAAFDPDGTLSPGRFFI